MKKDEKQRRQAAYRDYVRLTEGRSRKGNLRENPGFAFRPKSPLKTGSQPPSPRPTDSTESAA